MTIKKPILKAAPLTVLASFVASVPAYAQSIQDGINAAQTDEGPTDLTSVIEKVISVLLFIVGVAAVIMLIFGGIRYVISGGDQQAVTNAKNTIMYAIVGIIVALVAYALVQYVYDQLSA